MSGTQKWKSTKHATKKNVEVLTRSRVYRGFTLRVFCDRAHNRYWWEAEGPPTGLYEGGWARGIMAAKTKAAQAAQHLAEQLVRHADLL